MLCLYKLKRIVTVQNGFSYPPLLKHISVKMLINTKRDYIPLKIMVTHILDG